VIGSWDDDGVVLSVFTDQAYNLILLAEDEARMLGRSEVEPKHVLLALARRGNVESMLTKRNITAGDIHRVLVARDGIGSDLVLGQVPRSKATNQALERAVNSAAERGVLGPSSEYVLLGVSGDDEVTSTLHEVGVEDVVGMVDAHYPSSRPPVSAEQVLSYLMRVGEDKSPPSPGPIPPVFERFTLEAKTAIRAGEKTASELRNAYVEPFHFLLGMLRSGGGLAAAVLRSHDIELDRAIDRARVLGPGPSHDATGIFTDQARQIVAQDALKHAHRHGHLRIGTGHLLLATLETDGVVTQLLGPGPVKERIAAEVIRKVPGDEQPASGPV
jgi:ATP-dependent Clp protease ATP-binding subunit ClpA